MKLTITTSLLLLAACSKSPSTNGVDAPAGGGDAPATMPDAPAGANTITGMVGGTPFTSVNAAYWIGKPDRPGTDTVIYVFDRAVLCNQMTLAGWDGALPAGTQILEMKMAGTTLANYPNGAAANPAAGQSYSGYTVAMPNAGDTPANSGFVTLTKLDAPTSTGFASGAFHLIIPGGSLDGTYAAGYCATGREP